MSIATYILSAATAQGQEDNATVQLQCCNNVVYWAIAEINRGGGRVSKSIEKI